MLKLTVKAGEYLNIGKDIRVVFTGGSSQNMHVLVDAPREYNIVRSDAVKDGLVEKRDYYKDKDLSQEAKAKIKNIIVKDLRNDERQATVVVRKRKS